MSSYKIINYYKEQGSALEFLCVYNRNQKDLFYENISDVEVKSTNNKLNKISRDWRTS